MPPSVEIQIKAAVDQANASLQKIEQRLTSMGKSGKSAQSTLSMAWTELNSAWSVGQRVLGTLNQIADQTIGEFVRLADETENMSRVTGMSAEESSKLIGVTKLLGISQGVLEAATRSMLQHGLTPSISILAELADKYVAIHDPAARGKFLLDNFGRSGLQMGELMERGAGGVEVMSKAIHNLMTEEDIARAKEFNIRVAMFNDTLGTMKTEAARAFFAASDAAGQAIAIIEYKLGILSEEDFKRAIEQAAAFKSGLESIPTEVDVLVNIRQQISTSGWGNYPLGPSGHVITPGGYLAGQGSAGSKYGPVVEGPGGKMYRMNNETGRYEPAGQHGLDMVVPAGYPNDSFQIWASSGEGVHITPANQVTHNYYLTANYGRGESEGSLRDHMRILELLHG